MHARMHAYTHMHLATNKQRAAFLIISVVYRRCTKSFLVIAVYEQDLRFTVNCKSFALIYSHLAIVVRYVRSERVAMHMYRHREITKVL